MTAPVLSILDKLRETEAIIAGLERDIVQYPNVRSLGLQLKSLTRQKELLESDFLAITEGAGVDVCRYRILTAEAQPKLSFLTSAMGEYQSVLSLFFDAIQSGAPKNQARLSTNAITQSSLDFAYTFAGSVGFVLTVPNERLLLIESVLDDAVRTIFEVAKAKTSPEVLAFAHKNGRAPIRALFRWADAHVKAEFSADIEWRRGQSVRHKTIIQKPEFEHLQRIIQQTSEEEASEISIPGQLLGADVKSRTFHMQPDQGKEIRGTTEAIDETHTVEMPKRYHATIRKVTRINYSTEEELTSYELIRLQPV